MPYVQMLVFVYSGNGTFSKSCSVKYNKSSFYYVSHIYCLNWKNANKKQLCMRGLRHPLGEIIMNEYE